MADQAEHQNSDESESKPGVGRFLYRLALAGVGGVVLAQEELSGLFRRPASAGDPPADAPTESTEPGEAPSPPVDVDPATRHMDATIDRVLHTFNLPSRTDVDELTQKIDALAAKVKALKG